MEVAVHEDIDVLGAHVADAVDTLHEGQRIAGVLKEVRADVLKRGLVKGDARGDRGCIDEHVALLRDFVKVRHVSALVVGMEESVVVQLGLVAVVSLDPDSGALLLEEEL